MKIRKQALKETVHCGRTCVVGKLIAKRMISKETIRATLLKGWKPFGFHRKWLQVLGKNLFLIDFWNERDKT
jgi:hypothetical protein